MARSICLETVHVVEADIRKHLFLILFRKGKMEELL